MSSFLDLTLADIITAIASGLALVVSVIALRHSKTGQQFSTIDKILNDMSQLDTEVADLHKLYQETKNTILVRTGLDLMLSRLFNKLDWISFLINEGQINDKSLLNYLYPIIKRHYETTYLPSASKRMKRPSEYINFKQLYEKIKNDKTIY